MGHSTRSRRYESESQVLSCSNSKCSMPTSTCGIPSVSQCPGWRTTQSSIAHSPLKSIARRPLDFPLLGWSHVEVGVAPPFALLEATHAVAIAEHEPRLLAVVAAAPLEYGSDTLVPQRASGPWSAGQGVRRDAQDEQDPAFCVQPPFCAGRARCSPSPVSPATLACGITSGGNGRVGPHAASQPCPETTWGSPISGRSAESWSTQLERWAGCPNVWRKPSGRATEAHRQHWQAEDLCPDVDHVLAVFGHQRLMFGSDWPVAFQAASDARWIDAPV